MASPEPAVDAASRAADQGDAVKRQRHLLGPREEFRPSEMFIKQFARFAPVKYRAVEASDLTRALIGAAKADVPGHRTIELRDIPRAG